MSSPALEDWGSRSPVAVGPTPAALRIVVRNLIVVIIIALSVLSCRGATFGESRSVPSILLTNDGEGHVGPCAICPIHTGLGGLARRATLIARERENGPLLLLDAGNCFFGGDSAASGGKVIVAAYDAMGYDAVNISYRDFRHGRDATLALLQGAKFHALSANLLDAMSGRLLFEPYIVRRLGAQRVAILGLTESPAGLQYLPLLKEQLAGVRIRPPLDAMTQWLPAAKAHCDHVILLYYGSLAGLEPIQRRFGNDLSVIVVGGSDPAELPPSANPTMAASEKHGRTLARVAWGAANVEQIPVAPSVVPDAAMQKLVSALQASDAR